MVARSLRPALLAALLLACGPEGDGGQSPGQLVQTSAPAVSVSAPPTTQPPPDEVEETDGGGLMFDPSSKRLILPPSGPPRPRVMRSGVPLPADSLGREEQVGVVLTATFKQRDVGGPPKAPEVDVAGVEAARLLTAPTVTVTATALGRMKIVSTSRALPLPFRSELRSRFDLLGSLVLWPGNAKYRLIPVGALRTTFGERRVDVTPLTAGTRTKSGTGKQLDLATRSVVVQSGLARIRLELASVTESGVGGPLLCRALVELAGVDPATSECKPEELPLFAAIDWLDGGGIDFEVTALDRRQDLSPGEVLVPPPGATVVTEGLPEAPDGIYLTQTELAAFRSKGVLDVKPPPGGPADGFVAENGHDFLMLLFLDGVPVVGVPAQGQRYVIGPLRGRYSASWRTFLGEKIEEAVTVSIPGVIRSAAATGDQDAGP